MECKNCGAEWKVPQNTVNSLKVCPFCGAALLTVGGLNTAEAVLREIIDGFGPETLRDGKKTIGLFADLSPSMKGERVLLKYLIDSDGNNRLLAARNKSVAEQQACYCRVLNYMMEEQFVAEEPARRICLSFAAAIGLTVTGELPKNVVRQPETIPDRDGAAFGERPVMPPVVPASTADPVVPAVPSRSASGKSRQESRKPGVTKIATYDQYKKALEQYCVQSGWQPLSESQIRQFINLYELDKAWKITVADVEKDLRGLYAKHNLFYENKNILSYGTYMRELERAYRRNGNVMLTDEQIGAFLETYKLTRKFGIEIKDVKEDLWTIAKQNS